MQGQKPICLKVITVKTEIALIKTWIKSENLALFKAFFYSIINFINLFMSCKIYFRFFYSFV